MIEIDFDELAPCEREPEDVKREDGYFASWDDTELYWQVWHAEEPTAVVALMHGYAEHSSRYHHVASALVRAGYAVMAIDARGHGKSTGRRGHVDEFEHFVLDFEELLSRIENRFADAPIFALGHSHGGLIALRHALRDDSRIKGYVTTSPFCGFKVEVPLPKALAGNLMSRVWPTLSLPTDLDAKWVSHVPAVVDNYAADPLVGSVATARWFTEVKKAQADLISRAPELEQPFLFLVAGDDHIVDAEATEEIYHRMGSDDRAFKIYADLYHEILNEHEWTEVIEEMVGWIEERRA